MKTLAALLTAIVLSISTAYAAEPSQAEGKRPAARQTHKQLKPAELLAGTKKYLAQKASRTAEIIRINASKLKQTVWGERQTAAAKAAAKERNAGSKDEKDEPAKRGSP